MDRKTLEFEQDLAAWQASQCDRNIAALQVHREAREIVDDITMTMPNDCFRKLVMVSFEGKQVTQIWQNGSIINEY